MTTDQAAAARKLLRDTADHMRQAYGHTATRLYSLAMAQLFDEVAETLETGTGLDKPVTAHAINAAHAYMKASQE